MITTVEVPGSVRHVAVLGAEVSVATGAVLLTARQEGGRCSCVDQWRVTGEGTARFAAPATARSSDG
jgi:hypothetical protein